MTAMIEISETERMRALLNATPGWSGVAEAHGLVDETVGAILDEAARFARERLRPLGRKADAEGCRLVSGRVVTPDGYSETYAQMGRDGWFAMDLPEALGGQGLPIAIHSAASSFSKPRQWLS